MSENARLRVVFAGTPEFAAQHFQALIDAQDQAGFEVVAAYTQPDRPSGRGKKLSPSPVKKLALDNNIEVFQPLNFKDAADVATLEGLQADLLVVVAYGLLLPKAVLDLPTHGCINVHGSLLPRWRGAAPIQRAVESGDRESGVTIMQMDVGLDTGDMLLKAHCDIGESDTSASLHDRLIELGRPALLEVIDQIRHNSLQTDVQDDSLATYASKISKAEAEIDWHQDPVTLDRQIRAFMPFPISYTTIKGERLRIWQAEQVDTGKQSPPGTLLNIDKEGIDVACGGGALRLTQIQLPGKKAMAVKDILSGYKDRFTLGEQLGS